MSAELEIVERSSGYWVVDGAGTAEGPFGQQTDAEIQLVAIELSWMSPDEIEAAYSGTDLDDLARCENRDRQDYDANLWQLASDIVLDDKERPSNARPIDKHERLPTQD